MCCAGDMTSEPTDEFNALPADWASHPELLAGLTVDDDDEHDDPVLRWPEGRTVDTWREDYPYPERMSRPQYEYEKRPLQMALRIRAVRLLRAVRNPRPMGSDGWFLRVSAPAVGSMRERSRGPGGKMYV
jgi:hypothetical protein